MLRDSGLWRLNKALEWMVIFGSAPWKGAEDGRERGRNLSSMTSMRGQVSRLGMENLVWIQPGLVFGLSGGPSGIPLLT